MNMTEEAPQAFDLFTHSIKKSNLLKKKKDFWNGSYVFVNFSVWSFEINLPEEYRWSPS